MKIAYVAPGTGGTFYCENCIRDNALVSGLLELGHDVVMVPMYLPLKVNHVSSVDSFPIFFGAINTYLDQKSKIFRNLPRWFKQPLDHRFFLNLAAQKSGSVEAEGFEDLTLSMLKGEDGNQKKELLRMIQWLKNEVKPDVVHLANALLLGLAQGIKTELNIPVICSLQDEHVWINEMRPEYIPELWKIVNAKSSYVDLFITVSDYYKKEMENKIQNAEIQVIPIGLDISKYNTASLSMDPPVIGYLSRLCESHGVGILVDAFIKLKRDAALKNLKLALSGGVTGADKPFMNTIIQKLKQFQVDDDVEIYEDFDLEHRAVFLQELSILTVPNQVTEAFGAFQIEALASGVPVVLPKHSGFLEFYRETSGSILYEPNHAEQLANTLRSLLLDPAKTQKLAKKGQKIVKEKYSHLRSAEKIVELYRAVVRS